MASFKYIARDAAGVRKEGLRQAASANDVLGWLREQGFTPVSVNETVLGSKKGQRQSGMKRIKSADLAALCWQLTTMVEGGIPITEAITVISDDIDNLQLQRVLRKILEKMHQGEILSTSMSQFPGIFNKLSIAIVLAGETGGNLSDALFRLASYFDNRDKLKKKVQGAMAYPIVVLVFIILIVIFIVAFIIPRFTCIFDQFGGKLPAFTRGFMAVYNFIHFNVAYIVGAALLLIISSVFFYKTVKGHYIFCRAALAFPLIGKILSQAFIAIFCRTMSALLSAGVSVVEVFDILASMTNNDIIKAAVKQAREQVIEGASVSFGLAASGFFPNMVVKMIEVGEKSGSLSRVLDRTADYYERKVDATITTVMGLLEPIMIVVVGGIVLVTVLALYLPIFSMSDVQK
jgi:type II secretory pathway component PulF